MTVREMAPHRRARRRKDAVVLRPAAPHDLDDLAALEVSTFAHDRLSPRSLRRFAARGSHLFMIAEDADGTVVGYALTLLRKRSAKARLYSIAVAASARQCGIGDLLLGSAEAGARERGATVMRLEVRPDNRAADWYRDRGYRAFEHLYGYYEDGTDALRMEKQLGAAAAPMKRQAPPAADRARRTRPQ